MAAHSGAIWRIVISGLSLIGGFMIAARVVKQGLDSGLRSHCFARPPPSEHAACVGESYLPLATSGIHVAPMSLVSTEAVAVIFRILLLIAGFLLLLMMLLFCCYCPVSG